MDGFQIYFEKGEATIVTRHSLNGINIRNILRYYYIMVFKRINNKF